MKSKFVKKHKVLIPFVGLLFGMFMVFGAVFVFKAFSSLRRVGGYISDTEDFEGRLVNYLDDYYLEHGHYPDNLDISQFEVHLDAKYREIIYNINYSTDGNCFELVWKRPTSPSEKPALFKVGQRKGCNGKASYYHFDIVDRDGEIIQTYTKPGSN